MFNSLNDFNAFNDFYDMTLNSEHEQNRLEEELCNYYLEDDSLQESDGYEESEAYDAYEGYEKDDGEKEIDFESSQLHQLIHTQPIHLINYQMLSDHNFREEKKVPDPTLVRSSSLDDFSNNIEDLSENGFNVSDGGNTINDHTAVTSATSTNFEDALSESAPEKWNHWKEQISIPSFYENMDMIFRSRSNDSDELNNIQELDWEVPRSFPIEYRDPRKYLDFQEESTVPVLSLQLQEPHHPKKRTDNNNNNYNYRIKTDTSSSMNRRSDESENSFVRTLNSKLLRYTGYFGAGSRDQEYYDKVRFQEISYKFSKTYF